jgi:hypothetical protein
MDMAKDGLNVCPICWMPLYIGDGDEADAWCQVQVLFKNKPSQSTEHPFTTERNRPSHVFGLPYADINCQGCHFVHRSAQGKSLIPWDNYWADIKGVVGEDDEYSMQINRLEPNKNEKFLKAVCLEKSIFKLTDGGTKLFDYIKKPINQASFDAAIRRLFTVFPGCKDCNGKMTVNEFIEPIFNLLFPKSTYSKKSVADARATFDNEGRVCYLMLSGLLAEQTELIAVGDGSFRIATHERRISWRFRVMLVWCQLQILFCMWKWASLPTLFGHHVGYIYTGSADLYVSFILYIMHNLAFMAKWSHHFVTNSVCTAATTMQKVSLMGNV